MKNILIYYKRLGMEQHEYTFCNVRRSCQTFFLLVSEEGKKTRFFNDHLSIIADRNGTTW
ncbi:hypothetical protein [Sporolactobacillus putidus]|uniref:Uncharacterized protein n=1 Tax=Sporolactobacillus putidus TaxID=492735 RepID=A0A917S1Y5_9BACL|nr:hypothetical protein [Sporolactobacillus putidus]GGL49599.1 hypothetical protein GCM10007968_12200 [Sporolactobacillus putidus]